MSTIILFPASVARRGSSVPLAARDGMGQIVILPVVRIERDADATSDGRGPEEGAAKVRRRRRRARS